MTPTQRTTLFDTSLSSLAAPLFTANLKRGAPGTYNFGYIDNAQYTGAITYTALTSTAFWQINLSGYAVGSKPFKTQSVTAIVDTGSTLLILPQSIVNDYYSNISGARYSTSWGSYLYPCKSIIPDFTFGADKYRGKIPGAYMTFAQINATHCYGGLQSNGGSSLSILGDILIKAQFIVFDAGNKRLGFAAKNL